jgi:CRP/FNR family transcriptional regulator
MLFAELSDKEYGLVNDARKEYIFKRGEVIRKEGEPIKSFLYLRRGLVKLYKTDKSGKDQILSINKPTDFINLLSIFSNSTYKYSISALEETHVCDVELQALLNVLRMNSDFAMRVLNRISKISDEIIENRFEINQKQVKGRVAHILLFLADNIYRKNTFRMPITRREVGELISMTTENTIRTFSEFKKDGIISIEGKVITIEDYDRLRNVNKTG